MLPGSSMYVTRVVVRKGGSRPAFTIAISWAMVLVAACDSTRCLLIAEESDGNVAHVYVLRRALAGTPGSVRELAHSALLLRTRAGHFFTLEFMDDSRAHLTRGEPEVIERREGCVVVTMAGWTAGGTMQFKWERQAQGRAVEPMYSPQRLREMMQTAMSEYSVWKKVHCHTAQERVRSQLGILESARRPADD